ncbi:BREX-1 system adenine-specific DNA-methyltransferase PglX [Brytella acorum]|uniref:site-specific DNA-methyltransferase (adenine-specific) n=1 Tax=Brytella acorum TaxID=2959299 RepID=A0AA35UU64_9PROT|nr:BREX-1 system adenine-specific DNA-methyltransferase PglX [Brytella acorum]CAI9119515.1 BREX-1 system adenine-specific DNA-methyltransferase PglX [Brytella acorum]
MDAITPMSVPQRKTMDTGVLKKFAQEARRTLRDQVSAKLVQVLAENSAARREAPKAVQQLESEIGRTSRDQVVERVAYTWFNRFTALRFMDANGYTTVRVVTPADGQTRPEILSEAMAGVVGEEVPEVGAAQIRALLESRTPSPDPQGEAYRRLLVATCNHWHTPMPFLFEKIDDYSELLMPKDLLSQTSILARLREVMTDDACQDVEIIGWLYQFYRILCPEDIRICDPACGSGHMITYAFDLLHAIYEEEGYDAAEIPGLILKHNLTGVEIDDRAGALAAFALAMKAAAKLGRRRFLRMEAKPNIIVLQNVAFSTAEMTDVATVVGRDLFTDELRETLVQFEQAKNFGSLIVPKLQDPAKALRLVQARDFGSDLLLKEVQQRVTSVLQMAEALSPKYHAVVANPPYAGAKGLNPFLKAWIESEYPDSKADLMTCFMDRAATLTLKKSFWGMINLPSWLFLSSFDALRRNLLETSTLSSLLQLGRGIFGADFGSVAFVVRTSKTATGERGYFRRLFDRHVEVRNPNVIEARFLDKADGVYFADPSDFTKIPGAPIAYWVNDLVRDLFSREPQLSQMIEAKQGVATADNGRFLRQWWEPSRSKTIFDADSDARVSAARSKWVGYNKGGEFRRWYGNQEFVLNWESSGKELYDFRPKSVIRNPDFFFRRSVSWSDVTSGGSAFRVYPQGFIFDSTGHSAFGSEIYSEHQLVCFANTKIAQQLFNIINPTIHLHVGYFKSLPALRIPENDATRLASRLVELARSDWDGYETSWNFTALPLLAPDNRAGSLEDAYASLRARWRGMVQEMLGLEEENNRLFIDSYGLMDEMTSEVPLQEVTLTCNPAYRYGGQKSDAELEALLLADTMREFLSYAVGCMFGRYSVDEPGLILSNQGDGRTEYLEKVLEPTFEPDADNVIPILDGDWFADDITERFRKFLRMTFGDVNLQENLAFVEAALGKKLRAYFTRDFYADHVKRYKRRPIYWLFSSPKGTFNALIYMHRYRPDTVSVVLNDYLREFRNKLEGHRRAQEALSISGDASPTQKTKALKEIESTGKQIEELDAWERDVLFPLATQKVEIDLDDGVKANYPKFGAALKPIKGLNDVED